MVVGIVTWIVVDNGPFKKVGEWLRPSRPGQRPTCFGEKIVPSTFVEQEVEAGSTYIPVVSCNGFCLQQVVEISNGPQILEKATIIIMDTKNRGFVLQTELSNTVPEGSKIEPVEFESLRQEVRAKIRQKLGWLVWLYEKRKEICVDVASEESILPALPASEKPKTD